MINYYEGTVFNTPAKTIVNTVNCVGVMGAGIALEFKLRFPEMYKDYKDKCNKNLVRIGRPYIYSHSDDLWILNFPTKKHWRNKSEIEWIEAGLKYFSKNHSKVEMKSVAFPKLGTNNGGLDWELVKDLMEKYLSNLDLDIYICLNEKNEAEGIEKKMLDLVNKADREHLIKEVGINAKQAKIIVNKQPVQRFWQINNFNGIGKKSYEKLFRYYYQLAKGKKITDVSLNDYNWSINRIGLVINAKKEFNNNALKFLDKHYFSNRLQSQEKQKEIHSLIEDIWEDEKVNQWLRLKADANYLNIIVDRNLVPDDDRDLSKSDIFQYLEISSEKIKEIISNLPDQ